MTRIRLLSFIVVNVLLTTPVCSQEISAGGGLRFASGDIRFDQFAGINSPGYGAHLALVLPITPGFKVYARTGIYYFSESAFDDHTRVVPLTGGFRLGFGAGGFLPYLGIDAGVTFVQFHALGVGGETVANNETQATWGPMLGFVVPMTSRISWDFSLGYQFLYSSPQRNEFLGTSIGLSFPL